jgi:succinoglycan biosynthesis transport protein ExoP
VSQVASRPPEDEYDLRYAVKVLRRRQNVIIATVLLLTMLSFLIALSFTPRYTAEATIVLEPPGMRILNFENEMSPSMPEDVSMINTHVKYMTSTSFVQEVIGKLGLLRDPEFRVRPSNGGPLETLGTLVVEVSSWAKASLVAVGLAKDVPADSQPGNGSNGSWSAPESVRLEPNGTGLETQGARSSAGYAWMTGPAQRDLTRSLSEEESVQEREGAKAAAADSERRAVLMTAATELFLDRLAVVPSGRSYALSVAFTSVDPETAARVTNAIAELYVEHQFGSKWKAASGALDWLAGRLNELRAQLVDSEKVAEAYREKNELLASGRGLEFGDQELAALSQELIRARAERLAGNAKLRRIDELRSSGESMDSVPEIMQSPLIANLRELEMDLLREEARLRWEYGPRHPKIIQIEAHKAKLSARIDGEIHHVIGSLTNEIATIQAREETLQAKLEDAKAGFVQNSRAEIQLRLLEREAESTRTLYTTFLDRFKQLTEQRELLEPGVRVISKATVPPEPSFPQVKLMTGAGFMGSITFAMLLAFVVDRLDRGLRSGRQAEEVLSLPSIGFIPKVRAASRGRQPHLYLAQKPTSAYAESVRAVQTSLYFSNVDRPPQVVLVTSSVPSEGKTTLALSLASLLAASGYRTVATDLDLRAPALGRRLRKSEGGDLIDYMRGQKKLDQIVHDVDKVKCLHVIPTRRLAGSPTDLLASQRMATLMTELRARYDYIVLDSPPVLGMSDARFAALVADTVVFVVRWGKTKDELALKALSILRDGGAKIAGTVLAQVNVRRQWKYGPEDTIQYYGRYKRYYIN